MSYYSLKLNSKSRSFVSPNLYKTKFMLYRQKSECREFLSTVYFCYHYIINVRYNKNVWSVIKLLFVYLMYSILSIQTAN